jgi:hypothetical protein
MVDGPSIEESEVDPMPIENDTLQSLWPNLEDVPVCDEGMNLAKAFLEAAGECVNSLGKARTSSSRADLLWTYNAMVLHSDGCQKCNAA